MNNMKLVFTIFFDITGYFEISRVECLLSYKLLKIFKGVPNDFSIEDNAMHTNFDAHLLSLDKETELLVHLP